LRSLVDGADPDHAGGVDLVAQTVHVLRRNVAQAALGAGEPHQLGDLLGVAARHDRHGGVAQRQEDVERFGGELLGARVVGVAEVGGQTPVEVAGDEQPWGGGDAVERATARRGRP
jgi:hypothetical protein